MNTPIKSISDDQNTITHESGVVTLFVESKNSCIGCCYGTFTVFGYCNPNKIPCIKTSRADYKNGIFKIKP